jgi:hypothetical protein
MSSNDVKEVEIVSTVDIPSQDPKRIGKFDVLVTYRVDMLHTFSVRIPKEEATTTKIEEAIRNDYAKRKELIGRKVKVI